MIFLPAAKETAKPLSTRVLCGEGTVELDFWAGIPIVSGVGIVEKQIVLAFKLATFDPYATHGVCCIVVYEPFPDQGKV